jgi:hypothetical protein
MIVQSAPQGSKHFVITMDQHTAFSAQLASAFGNEQFEAIEPRSLMLHVIAHHDAGWRDLDAAALRDPETGLPYNLVKTPFERILKTSSASPDFNGKTHPFCELLSSMHSWGLYNGRYGMSEKVLLNSLADENRTNADTLLNHEIERQERLKSKLASDPETAAWIDGSHLFQNYKQLQLFDTMALYFNCLHAGNRGQDTFTHVPMTAESDTSVSIEELGDGRYRLDPFPFRGDNVEVSFNGRYMAPVDSGENVKGILDQAPIETQTVRLVRNQ